MLLNGRVVGRTSLPRTQIKLAACSGRVVGTRTFQAGSTNFRIAGDTGVGSTLEVIDKAEVEGISPLAREDQEMLNLVKQRRGFH